MAADALARLSELSLTGKKERKTARERLLTIVGATASGKTDAAVLVAEKFGGEVVNADSRLFYRGLDIGTAKPPPELLDRVPHHLIGFLGPTESFSVAEFLVRCRVLISQINSRGNLPVLAGGSGQYVWGLLEGWQVPEVAPDPALRDKLERTLQEHGVHALYERLLKEDPTAAGSVDPRNHRRIIRAFERARAGHPAEAARKRSEPEYDCLVIGLQVSRKTLHQRVRQRVDNMIAAGWQDEVSRLLREGVPVDAPAMSSIGYREMAACAQGQATLDDVREKAAVATNRLIRRQNNWFKPADPRIEWVDVTDGNLTPVIELAGRWLAPRSSGYRQHS